MINLTKGQTQTIYFTGTEKATIALPYFLFVFTNRVTEEVIKVMATNTSTSTRYDKFSLVVNTSFSTATEGTWDYSIYEKLLVSDLTVAGVVVERGFMALNPATPFTPTEYAGQSNTFTTYNGL